jgi:hypothetical protein
MVFSLGKHTQDPVISFYPITPSGFAFEYLHGGMTSTAWDSISERNPENLSVWGHKPGRPRGGPARAHPFWVAVHPRWLGPPIRRPPPTLGGNRGGETHAWCHADNDRGGSRPAGCHGMWFVR